MQKTINYDKHTWDITQLLKRMNQSPEVEFNGFVYVSLNMKSDTENHIKCDPVFTNGGNKNCACVFVPVYMEPHDYTKKNKKRYILGY